MAEFIFIYRDSGEVHVVQVPGNMDVNDAKDTAEEAGYTVYGSASKMSFAKLKKQAVELQAWYAARDAQLVSNS